MITRIGGKRVFPIGVGTWRMGGGAIFVDRSRDEQEIKALKFALDNKINLLDTAELYGKGHAEELVGQAIKGRDREKLFIISKVFLNNMSYKRTIDACRNSLKRLNTKYIDLYLIHWPNPLARMYETIRAMETLIDNGLIRSMGVSNFEVKAMKEAMFYTKRHSITANEISYSVMRKEPEQDIIPFCKRNGIAVIAHTPLAQGRAMQMREVVEIAAKYRKKPVQVALNYLLKNSLPIPKASNPKHIRDIVGSVGWTMKNEDYETLKAA